MLFAKYSGAENLFLVALATLGETINNEQAKRICKIYGTDGALLVKKTGENSFQWDFYNADGSTAEMCGNAARCVLHYLLKTNQVGTACTLETLAGIVSLTKAIDGTLKVGIPTPMEPIKKNLLVEGQNLSGDYIVAGVPHLILSHPGAILMSKEECRTIRNHKQLSPRGANVTVIQESGIDAAFAKTYERGVEDFTKACGTGAIAAATYLKYKNKITKAKIEMPGGTLFVEFFDQEVLLSGPTVFEREFEINLSALK